MFSIGKKVSQHRNFENKQNIGDPVSRSCVHRIQCSDKQRVALHFVLPLSPLRALN